MTPRWRLLLMVAVILATTACSGSDGPDTASAPESTEAGETDQGEITDIEVTLFGGGAEIAAYEELAAAFEAANPDVTVTLNPVEGQDALMASLTTSFAGGEPPDAFLANYLRYGQFASQGVLADVQPYLDDSDVISVEDFAEPPLEAFRFDGETLTCMPQNISSLNVFYNVDLFEAAGVELPAEGWTWDDFLAAAQALTDADAGQYGVGVEPSLQRLAPFVWSAGGEVVDDQQTPTTLTIDEGPARTGLDFFLDLQLEHGVAPPDAEEQSLESEERFVSGELAMFLDSRRAVPTLREGITGFTWDVAPLPVAPGGSAATILHGDAYCLTRDGNPDVAWRFVEFAMTAEGQEILASSGRTVPSRLDVANSPVFLEPDQPPASAQVYLDVIPTIQALPRTATWAQMQDEFDTLLADTYYGRIGRDEGVAAMIEAAEAVFAIGN